MCSATATRLRHDEGKEGDEDKGEKGEKPSSAAKPELVLMLLTDGGELVRVPTSTISAIRPLDPTYAGRLATALDAVTQRGAQSQRMLRLLSRDGGPITLGYLAETPLWRVTYRLVVGDQKGNAGLQGLGSYPQRHRRGLARRQAAPDQWSPRLRTCFRWLRRATPAVSW